MDCRIVLTRRAIKDLSKLSKKIAERIIQKLEQIEESENPMKNAKPLHGELRGLHRFRVGDYRVIFEKAKDQTITILLILNISDRKEVYK